jgi:hypothetical protein
MNRIFTKIISIALAVLVAVAWLVSQVTPAATLSPAPSPSAPPSTPARVRLLELNLPGAASTVTVTDEGLLTAALSAITLDQDFSLSLDSGTRINVSNEGSPDSVSTSQIGDKVPAKISVTRLESGEEPAFPQGWVQVSPFFDINGVTNGYIHGVSMDHPAHMVIRYDAGLLPENVDNLATFYYSYQYGWTQLEPPEGFIAEAGQTAADTNHFSLFVVLAKAATAPQPPAHFEVYKLTLDPSRILVNQSSEVRVKVSNTGGTAGDYNVVVKVNGKIQKTQSVILGPGESREIHLILSPGINGTYTVEVAGISAKLVVDPLAQADIAETSYWWLLFIAMGCALLVLALFRRKRRESPDSD